MRGIRFLALAGALAAGAGAQTIINGSRRILGQWDASQATATKVARQAASDPSTCAEGEVYYNTAAHKHRQCQGTNTWADLGSSNPVLTSYHQYVAGKCQSGIPIAAFSLPPANAPTATCVSGGSTVAGTLQFFGSGGSAQSVHDHFELPPDWTGTIDVELAYRSQDATNSATATIYTGCVATGSGADIGNPPLPAAGSATITADAGNGRTAATLNGIGTAGCAAGQELFWKLAIDTGAMPAPLELISVRFTVRRTN